MATLLVKSKSKVDNLDSAVLSETTKCDQDRCRTASLFIGLHAMAATYTARRHEIPRKVPTYTAW